MQVNLNRLKRYILALVLIFTGASVFCQNGDFSEGEKLFRQNRPKDAVPYLKSAVESGSAPKAYNYLALCYFQLGEYNLALDVCNAGLKTPGTDKKVLAYNAGNICFAKKDYAEAEKWYSLAVSADGFYSEPVLNRANARLNLGKLAESKADYEKYIELAPDDVQRPEIEKLLVLLSEEIVVREEERVAQEKRLLEEQQRIKEEEERLAEAARIIAEQEAAEKERIAREESEKRRKLLEEVAASLQKVESENMSAGAEGTIDYDYETELE